MHRRKHDAVLERYVADLQRREQKRLGHSFPSGWVSAQA
jgi:hypothetical protein